MLPSKTVVGLFKDQKETDRIVDELRAGGISGDSVRMVNSRELEAHETNLDQGSRADKGEGIILLLNRLFGIDHRMEFGRASTLYTDWIRNGGVLVAVHAESRRADEAAKIMERYAGEDITSRTRTVAEERELKRGPLPVTEATSGFRAGDSMRDLNKRDLNARDLKENVRELTEEETTIPVVQEELRVGKRKVQRGPVRVSKHISETPVEETVELRDETVTVERHTVDRLASEADLKSFADSKIEMTETTEEPIVSKEAHVIEEITMTKRAQDHTEKIRDKVRKTEIDIEGLGADKLRDLEFRKNFQARFAGGNRKYEEYMPAYELGDSLAADERFKGRDWSSLQGEARRLWETKKSGSWNDFVDAVRHGWERRRNRAA